MPTVKKEQQVEEIRDWMGQCTIAISTDHTGISVTQMTALRRALREQGVQYKIVKNTLALLAADAAGRPELKSLIDGPTAIAFTFGEEIAPAKVLAEYIRTSRSSLKIRGGVMGDRTLTAAEINTLATLPPKDVLIAQLLGQLNGPVAGLVRVLNGPISGLARVIQRRIEAEGMVESEEAVETESEAETEGAVAAETA